MFFWKRERQIEQAIEDYLQETENCLAAFGEAFDVFFNEGLSEHFNELVERTHSFEHLADGRRRQIEATMYDKALIPESRGDILGMLEALDLAPGKAESVLHQVWTQSMAVPAEYVEMFRRLIQVNIETYDLLCQSMRDLFLKAADVPSEAAKVSAKEAESDRMERTLIKAIFDSQMEKADKILLKELVVEIGEISDRAEDASDRLRIVAVKRRS